jgi:surfeit locus 1 family protein
MIRCCGFRFRPALLPSLATLVLLPLLTGLGFWQLDRAGQKQAIIDRYVERLREPALELSGRVQKLPQMPNRRVIARGRYDLEHQVLIDNRTHEGRPGYHVLTPLRLEGAEGVVLVNRGWIAMGPSRAQLPEAGGPVSAVTVRAVASLPPKRVFRLGGEEENRGRWPVVLQQPDIAVIESYLGQKLSPVILLLDPGDPNGFVRDWKPVYGISPDKHRAYAWQWFSLAVLLVVIYVGVNTRRLANEDKVPP